MTCPSHASAVAGGDGRKSVAASRRGPSLRTCAVAGLLLAAVSADRAMAADWPDDAGLRGSIATKRPIRWDGFLLGGQLGYSNMLADFVDSNKIVPLGSTTTSSRSYGGFVGYNMQWDELVVGFDGAYNRPSSLETSTSTGVANASLKLIDYGTFRARGGYVIGQFLPYAFVGAAVGRMNYATTVSGSVVASRDGAFAGGFVGGVGVDVALLPNVFLRGEYEYVAFSQLGGIRSSLNTARVGLGLRF